MQERPGIMFYFDMAEPLKVLGYEEKGRLLEAILDYGQFGVVPEFDGLLTVAWGFIRPKLDVDATRYRKKVVKNTYSSYCAREKKNGNTVPLDFDEWCTREGINTNEWTQSVSTDTERYPTTTTDSTTAPTSTSTPTTATAPKSKPKTTTDGGGKGEEETVLKKDFDTLRREQINKLIGSR